MSRAHIAGLALVLAAGCGDEGSCPDPSPVEGIQSGQFQSSGGKRDACDGCSTMSFAPHEGVSPLDMEIDAEANRVVIRYQRDGKQIEEVWRMGARFEQ